MTDFDPNSPRDLPDHPWGTARGGFSGSHRGVWKTHARLRDVRAAIDATRSGISVWKRDGDKWVMVLELEPRNGVPILNPDTCHVCGKSVEGMYAWAYEAWSPDEDFVKVKVHGTCKRSLGVRRA